MKKTFEDFKFSVNNRIEDLINISIDDLPDVVCLHDYYYEGMALNEFQAAVKDCADEIISESQN